MHQTKLEEVLDSGFKRILLFGLIFSVLCSLFQFFFLVHRAHGQMENSILQAIRTAELPAVRSVLILDADLAQDVTKSLTHSEFILDAYIFEDHNNLLGEAKHDYEVIQSPFESILELFVENEKTITRTLSLPDSMSESPGKIKIVYTPSRGISLMLQGLPWHMFLTFLITLGAGMMIGRLSARS